MNTDRKAILSRVYIVYFFVCLFALVIVGQTVNIQVVEGAHWKEKAENLTIEYNNIEAVRGLSLIHI